MTKDFSFQNLEIFRKIKLLSNPARFKILEITQTDGKNITEIGKYLKISYKRSSEYVAKMEKLGLVKKVKEGKEVKVTSRVRFSKSCIEFY